MSIVLEEFSLQVSIWILSLIDKLMDLFFYMLGSNIKLNGEEGNLFSFLLNFNGLETSIYKLLIFGGILGIIFCIYSVIRNMVTGETPVKKIIGKFLITILGSISVIAIGYIALNVFISLFDFLINLLGRGRINLASSIFDSSCVEYINGYTIRDISFTSTEGILGNYTYEGLFPKEWVYNGKVNPDSFLYLPCLIGSIIVFYAILKSLISIGKNYFELIFLYISLPIGVAFVNIGDGLDKYINMMISRIFLVVSYILCFYVFSIATPLLLKTGIDNYNNIYHLIIILSSGAFLLGGGKILSSILSSNAGYDGELGFLGRDFRRAYRSVLRPALFLRRESRVIKKRLKDKYESDTEED